MGKKPVTAVVPLGHYIYFQQFEGLFEELNQKSREILKCFTDDTDVIVTDYVDDVEKAFEVVRELKRQDVDGIFMLLTTYLPSSLAAPFANYLDVPQILVGVQPMSRLDYEKCTTYMQLVNDDICAMPEIAGVYKRLGRPIPPCVVAARGQEERIRRQIGTWQRAIAARAAFKYAQIGYLGHTYEGMYDMHTDPTAFSAAFKCHVRMLEMCELAKRAQEVTEDQIAKTTDLIEKTFSIQDPSIDPLTDHVTREDLAWSARMACALEGMVKDNHLSALAYYYKGEDGNLYERMGAALIIGNTLLTSRGIPLAGEADLKTAAELFTLCVKIASAKKYIAISQGKPILRKLKKYHGKAGSGIGVEFSLKAGPVTMLSINCQPNGRFRLVAAAGISQAGAIPQTGNTNTRVIIPGMDVTDFISRWCEAGPTHHLALGTGNLIGEIRAFARIMDMDLTVVE